MKKQSDKNFVHLNALLCFFKSCSRAFSQANCENQHKIVNRNLTLHFLNLIKKRDGKSSLVNWHAQEKK